MKIDFCFPLSSTHSNTHSTALYSSPVQPRRYIYTFRHIYLNIISLASFSFSFSSSVFESV
jgi:hypothetical protein